MFSSNLFKNKHILIVITGGIAAYKSAELIRFLMRNEVKVKVIMTKAAEKFITRLTLETLSQNPVASEMFPHTEFSSTHHIHLADWADAVIVAPASYNFIGKIHSGIADDLVSAIMAAVHCPTVIAPAMNVHMWNNPVLQSNLKDLRQLGYLVCPPEEGFLAEGYSGKGRLAPLEHLIQYLYRAIHPRPNSLTGRKVLVSAGRTEESIDPVRILTNRSSGKMGYTIAWEAFARDAQVTLVHGPTNLPDPVDIKLKAVVSASEMFDAINDHISENDVYVSSAAIADYAPAKAQKEKKRKSDRPMQLELKATRDILKSIAASKMKNQQVIGFAMETNQAESNALRKLKEKRLNMIVLNKLEGMNTGMEAEQNRVTLFHENGSKKELPIQPKLDVAREIFNFLTDQQE